MNFAVVKVAGKQYLVNEGARFSVAANLGSKDQILNLSEVFLASVDDHLTIGTPMVDKSIVAVKILSSGLGEKIRVAKFKAKSRYRRVIGFRPQLTTLEVIKISQGDHQKATAKETAKAPKRAASKK